MLTNRAISGWTLRETSLASLLLPWTHEKHNRLYIAIGLALGLAFGVLAMSDISVGNFGTALHELLNAVMSWAASGVLADPLLLPQPLTGSDADSWPPPRPGQAPGCHRVTNSTFGMPL